MAGTIDGERRQQIGVFCVSMKSGLDGRNNHPQEVDPSVTVRVSMKSGLDGRNNYLMEEVYKLSHDPSQ